MIIVSQNKKEIINFDNVMSIQIFDCEDGEWAIFAAFIVGRDDNYRELGYYKSEKRAKEVLVEILKNVKKFRKNYDKYRDSLELLKNDMELFEKDTYTNISIEKIEESERFDIQKQQEIEEELDYDPW